MGAKKIFMIIGIVLCCLTLVGILLLPHCFKKISTASAYVVETEDISSLSSTALYGSYSLFNTGDFGDTLDYDYLDYYNNNFRFQSKFPRFPSGTSLTAFQKGYIVNYLADSTYDLMFVDDYNTNDNYFYLEYSTNYDFSPLGSYINNPFVSIKWDDYYMTFDQFYLLSNYFILGHNNSNLADNRYLLSIAVDDAKSGDRIYSAKSTNLSIYYRLSTLISYNDLVNLYSRYLYEDISTAVAYLDITINCYQYSNANRNVLYFTVPIVNGSTINKWTTTNYLVNEVYEPSPLDIIVGSLDSFFNIEVFPGFKLSYMLMISTAVLMIGIGTKLFLGD